MDQCLDRRLVDVSNVGCRLPWLPTRKHGLGVDETEGINHHLAFHRLDGINNHRNAAILHLFKRLERKVSSCMANQREPYLLCVDVDTR